ncbi:MAG TPA: hypothetical protein GX708_13030 [Gallicola sp.]|nr:hypothetical protein [Gallicola sp.]
MTLIIYLLIGIIQYIICWIMYFRWFKKNITHIEMKDSSSILGMIFCLPIFLWIPILPIIVILIPTKLLK